MYHVIVAKDDMGFDAAHFISFRKDVERLHGHNYRVSVKLEGSLCADEHYVFDFVELKKIVRGICKKLDHFFLLPLKSKKMQVRHENAEWEIRLQDRRYILPEEDVVPLPLDNITAEALAEYIAGELLEALRAFETDNLTALEVGVAESPGQTAYYRRDLNEGKRA